MQLLDASETDSFGASIRSVAVYIASIVAVAVVISVGMFVGTELSGYFPANIVFPVDRDRCTCDCWDGFYRGTHSRGGYKSFYFNYEKQTIVLLGILLFYSELLRKLLVQMVIKQHFRLVLLIPSIYSNFYGIWSFINYINDHDYKRMLRSQGFFSTTELVATYIFYQSLLIKHPAKVPAWFLHLLCTIALLHLFFAMGELNADKMRRNIALVLSDWLCLAWVTTILVKNPSSRPDLKTIGLWLLVALALWSFYHLVCPFRE